jgi:adenine phosphoribosyltransferase
MNGGNVVSLEQEIKASLTRGVVGKLDMLAIYQDTNLLRRIVCELAKPFYGKVDYVVSPEATGWILGIMMANELGVKFMGIRKGGNSPYKKERLISQTYVDYSKTQKELELRYDALPKQSKILLVDCWIETGATISACLSLINRVGCIPYGIATLNIEKAASIRN